MVVDNRRRLLFRHVDVKSRRGLEIGPYLQPTVRKDEGDVRYLDFYSSEELAAKEQDRRARGAVIPTVDYVVKSDDYHRYVPDQFDYVIANHVIEHVANPVQWVIDLQRLLRPGGVLFLAVPDKKYNFDRFRSDTPLSHLLTDYFRGDGDPHEHGVDIALNYDTAYVGKPIDLDERLTLATMKAAFDEAPHPGRHNHVFQSETFVPRILRPLQRMGLWRVRLLDFGDAVDNHGEFHLVLQQGEEAFDLRLVDVYGPAAAPLADPAATAPPATAARSAEAGEQELRQLRAQLAVAHAELQTMRRSLSWRVTGPVRRLLQALR